MNAKRRLVEEARGEFVRAVLESSRLDEPEPGARDRALAGLGLATAVVVASSVTAEGASAGTAGAGASAVAPQAAKGGALLVAKWMSGAAIAAALGVGAVARIAGPVAHPRPHAAAPLREPPAARLVVPQPLSSSAPPPPPSSSRALAPPTNKPFSAGGAPAPEPGGDRPETMMPQLQALAEIKSSLAGGDANGALRLIDAFAARYPASQLTEELLVLRIDALAQSGREDEVASRAVEFLARYPSSAYGERVRARLAAAK